MRVPIGTYSAPWAPTLAEALAHQADDHNALAMLLKQAVRDDVF